MSERNWGGGGGLNMCERRIGGGKKGLCSEVVGGESTIRCRVVLEDQSLWWFEFQLTQVLHEY